MQRYILTVHMMGTVVGVLFTRDSESFVRGTSDVFILYNWQTGVQLAVMISKPDIQA